VRIVNDPVALGLQLEPGPDPIPRWCSKLPTAGIGAVDVLQAAGAHVQFGASVGGQGFRLPAGKETTYATPADLADLLRMGPTTRGVDRFHRRPRELRGSVGGATAPSSSRSDPD